ncbi:MAG: magnesium-protoporphyrin IX monomethyl ester cyclase, partial [Cyanobacteria bacterium J06607_6]
ENRHGDIFKALLRSQPHMWQGWQARFWSRFFLLSVFATHSLTVHERSKFYEMLGLDAAAFDEEVVRQTNATAARAFPVMLNVDHPDFFKRLDRCVERNVQLKAIATSNLPRPFKLLRKVPHILGTAGDLLRLFLLKPIDTESLRATVR